MRILLIVLLAMSVMLPVAAHADDVENLIRNLENPKGPYMRFQAVQSLGKIGDQRAVGPLISLIRTERTELSPNTTYSMDLHYAMEALGKIGIIRKTWF